MSICQECGKSYQKTSNAQRYCSPQCKERARKKRERESYKKKKVNKKCIVCDKEFKTKSKDRKYCSRGCMEIDKGNRIKIACDNCGKIFYRKKSKALRYKNNYCSKECANKGLEVEKIKRVCKYCKSVFYALPWKSDQVYCSRQCNANSQRKPLDYKKLYELYVKQRLTTREVAKILGTNKKHVICELRRYRIEVRDSIVQRKGEDYRPPTKQELYKLYHDEFKTYEEIGKIYNVDATTVGIWMANYNIEARTAGESRLGPDYVKPTKEELEELYLDKKLTLCQLGELFGVSESTIASIMDKYNIERRSNILGGREPIECEDGHIVRSNLERIVDDYLYYKDIPHEYEVPLPVKNCRYKTDFYANGYYIEVWGITNSEEYDKNRKRKEKIYKENNLPLISINAEDFDDLKIVYRKLDKVSQHRGNQWE